MVAAAVCVPHDALADTLLATSPCAPQRKFDEGGASAIAIVFKELLENVVELMVDPFGNYLIQKLLDRCSEEQRLEVSC